MNKYTGKTFKEADDFLETSSHKEIGHHTYLVRMSDTLICVVFYETKIIDYHKNGRIFISTGGWKTNTTKERLNRFSNAQIHGQGTTHRHPEGYKWTAGPEQKTFFDGMEITW